MAARLDEDAASIAGDASPAIEALSAARGAMFRAEVAVARALESPPSGVAGERAAAEEAIRELRAREADYLRLPFYQRERDFWDEVDVATHGFEQKTATVLAAMDKGRTDEARDIMTKEIRPATERLDKALEFLIRFNVDQQHRMGAEILQLRRHAARTAYVLDAVSALLSVVLIALVVREARRRQLLLAQFSRRLEEIAAATARITGSQARGSDQRAVFEAIVQEACHLVDADYAALGFVVDRDRPFEPFVYCGFSAAEVKAIGRTPCPFGILGASIADGRPLRLDDIAKDSSFHGLPAGHPPMGAFLGVPVRRSERVAGNLYLARRPGRRRFTDEDEHIIQLLAAQAAVATQNASLYQELDEERRRAQLLADASSGITGSLEYEHTLEHVARAALPGFADACVLRVTDEGAAFSRTVMAAGDPAWQLVFNDVAARLGAPSERLPAARALRERRPLRFVVDSEFFEQMALDEQQRSLLEQVPMKHGLSVPIVGRDRLLGTLSFFTFRDAAFGDRDVPFAKEMARRVALSMDNSMLYQRSQRAVQSRDELLAIVSHDLRNPLGSLRMVADLLKRDAAADENKRLELADRTSRTIDRMMRLIEDLLSASKIESGSFRVEPKPESVAPLIGDAIEMFRGSAATKSIDLRAEVDADVPGVMCDHDRVIQVLSNLIGNALKFTPASGAITVSVRLKGEEVQISVRDTGIGIPEEARQHVFDRYWQATHARRASAGLGLYIAKGIVEAHGGRIWAEAGAEGGASVCFTLPACSASAPYQPHAPA